MAFTIRFSETSLQCVDDFRKSDRNKIIHAIEERLSHQPLQANRNRKKLRPNPLAEWELRVGEFRVFYNVVEADSLVDIVAVGYKDGNMVMIRGKEWRP